MSAENSIIMISVLLLLSACSELPDTAAEAPLQPIHAQRDAASDDAAGTGIGGASDPPAAPVENDSAVMADIEMVLGSADEYKSAFFALQEAVATGDKIAVSRLVDFPLSISVGGQRVVMDASQFVSDYDQIITSEIAMTITTQKFSDVMVNAQGLMFGDGEVWLSGSCMDEECEKQLVLISRIQEVSEDGDEFPRRAL